MVKELRTEVDRLIAKIGEQNKLLDIQSTEIMSLRKEIHILTLKMETRIESQEQTP